jgi:hypothetical protein
MGQAFTSIPFKTESGLSQVNGLAKFSAAGIVLEFESKFLGLIATGVKEVRLPLEDLLDVKFRKGVFKRGAKIEIRTKSFSTLAQLPNKEGKLTLKLSADDFDSARDAVDKLNKDLTEQRESLPPTHTPVSALFDESEEETRPLPEDLAD